MLPYKYQTRQLVSAQGFIKCEFVKAHQFGVFILQKQDISEETQIFFATSG